MKYVLIVMVFVLQACGGARVKLADGSEMSEALYAHQLSTAVAEQQSKALTAKSVEDDACYRTAGVIAEPTMATMAVAFCTIRGMAGAQAVQAKSQTVAPVPQFQAPPSTFDRTMQVVGVLAQPALGVAQLVAGDRNAERQFDSSVLIAGIDASREIANFGALANFGGVAVGAVQGTATSIARDGFAAGTAAQMSTERLGTAAVGAGAMNAAAWAATLVALPPTNQYTYGDNAVVGDGNDQSRVGRDRDVQRQVLCNAAGGNGGSATGSSGTTGAANPSAGSGAAGTNNCGG